MNLPSDQVFLCHPKDYPERTTAIIATSDMEARRKAMLNKSIHEAVHLLGSELLTKNLTEAFGGQGYDLIVQRKGMYH
jgi:hypothetical protein